ncbi:uncharacterized protein L3040_006536 [Drepanopeziza brunnea f. sp. 'multigermtubi']|uniref:Uncharacterized protein n=1 Tax=Marssonina brunnea f. sp. multigermtubi (strain MB_m1) TaxID=1072389 RepID=K1X1E2_MARBU|nr:uncharacterized protein MBM_02283 [Drepanopeziza brunnea f. sp. 'multigermtubi' MB_m1]EKD19046.1 hypothetical protein MBM_02283 [Drepanopeziza brunnea f. sp. 'multigermtubi' MB_m1]KAJ5038857.1 hypothetical protein L3040_006536 [Drepanopeziza brunnea f. sp. 'multigermtubi']
MVSIKYFLAVAFISAVSARPQGLAGPKACTCGDQDQTEDLCGQIPMASFKDGKCNTPHEPATISFMQTCKLSGMCA